MSKRQNPQFMHPSLPDFVLHSQLIDKDRTTNAQKAQSMPNTTPPTKLCGLRQFVANQPNMASS
jgi:hypothetical protein